MKKLFIIDTVLQLLSAIELNLGNMKEDQIDLFLSESMCDYGNIGQNFHVLQDLGFSNVYSFSWNSVQDKFIKKYPLLASNKACKKELELLIGGAVSSYDSILTQNRFYPFFLFYKAVKVNNKRVEISCYDEGLDSYVKDKPSSPYKRYEKILDKLFYYNPSHLIYQKIYLHCADLYMGENPNIVEIERPNYSEQELNLIRKLFDINTQMSFKGKYIFLEECPNTMKPSQSYINFENKIISSFNPENLYFKKHPRAPKPQVKTTFFPFGAPFELCGLLGMLDGATLISFGCTASFTSLFFSQKILKSIVFVDSPEITNSAMRSNANRVNSVFKKMHQIDDRLIVLSQIEDMKMNLK